MLRVQRITKSYGANVVLREASFEVRPGERVGLVGANGAGKTTLLDIVRGTLRSDSGQIVLTPGWQIGYLAQDTGLDQDKSVRQEMWGVFQPLINNQHELDRIQARMNKLDPSDPELLDLIQRQADLHDQFDQLGGHTAEAEIGKVLHGLGFSDEDAARPIRSFSGGWQVRIALARLLLGSADLLLLDEPTNHLDVSAVEWLEEYLVARPRTCLMVSHDRYFLDRVSTRTVELENAVITSYPGSYRRFVEEKQRRLDAQAAAFARQQEYLAEQRETLERFRAKATKARFVQSREKQLAKIEIVDAPERTRPPAFKFAEADRSGREVVRVRGLTKQYGDKVVLNEIELRVDRGDRIGLLGPNGAGKSTLLRILGRIEKPDNGTLNWGHNVRVGYFAQNAADVLDVKQTPFESVSSVAPPEWTDTDVRSVLGRFLFRGDDVFKPIRVLSGGERNRVALARLLARPYNLLLLDEPTNHLDIPAREALQAALSAYPGALILVTHDRYLVDRLANRIFAFQDGAFRVYDGDYAFYRRKLTDATAPAPVVIAPPPAAARQPGREVSRQSRRGAALAARSLAAAEAMLEAREARKAEVEALLGDPATYRDAELSQQLLDELSRLEIEVDELLERWAELAEEAG